MKTWLRKLRGILGIGAIWGLAGSVLGFALGAIVSLFWHDMLPITVVKYVGFMTLQHAVWGFVSGSGFAGVLTIMEGRKTLEELTPVRAALWGALTGVGFATVLGLVFIGLGNPSPLAPILATICMYGAMTAGIVAGTVSLAKRDPAMLGAGAVLDERKLVGGAHQFGPIWRQEHQASAPRNRTIGPRPGSTL